MLAYCKSAADCFWRWTDAVSLSSLRDFPAEYAEMRLLTVGAKLWRFPLLLGGCNVELPQSNRSSQDDSDSGWDETERKIEERWEAQAERADLGMCLINGQSAGDQIPDEPMQVPDKGYDVKDPSVAESERQGRRS